MRQCSSRLGDRGIPSGAAVVLVATAVFLMVFLFAPGSGAITSRVFRRIHHAHPERDTFADDAPVSA